MRISRDGSMVEDSWVTLIGEPGYVTGLSFDDEPGVFGGHLIAVTSAGGVWEIRLQPNGAPLGKSDRHPDTKFSILGSHCRGPKQFGKIRAECGWDNLVAVEGAPDGTGTFYTIGHDPNHTVLNSAYDNTNQFERNQAHHLTRCRT